ncbi:MAG: hypothetical protein M3Y53_09255 [Thermoproteota archaeon]|nr:hypothetical protein [Thermoproteota archaeon]
MSKETKNKSSGLDTGYSSFLRRKKVHPKHRILFSASAGSFLFFFITAVMLFPSIFAFGQNTSTGNIQNGVSNYTNSSTIASQPPIATKISDKGIYQVQLSFISTLPMQSPNLLPKSGFQMEIDFLNASASAPTSKTNSNLGMLTSQQNIIQRLVPVDSFDMAIYSNNGKVLWNKTNEAATGGRGTETVSLNGSYIGPITILINNIKSSNVMTDVTTPLSAPTPASTSTPTAGKGTTIDSVRFASKLT